MGALTQRRAESGHTHSGHKTRASAPCPLLTGTRAPGSGSGSGCGHCGLLAARDRAREARRALGSIYDPALGLGARGMVCVLRAARACACVYVLVPASMCGGAWASPLLCALESSWQMPPRGRCRRHYLKQLLNRPPSLPRGLPPRRRRRPIPPTTTPKSPLHKSPDRVSYPNRRFLFLAMPTPSS
jgi:hypothetical protein